MEQRDIPKNEHTLNIRAGLPVLGTMYGLSIQEYDYLDIAIDALRDIKHFGTLEYVSYITVDKDGKVMLPCNVDVIDAVTDEHMGRKAYADRKEFDVDGILNTDTYYSYIDIMNSLGYGSLPGLGGFAGKGYISFRLDGKSMFVSKNLAGTKIAVAYSGILVDQEGFPFITRKQANAIAAICARVIMVKGANKGQKGAANMIEYYTGISARLKQAASIPEDISDNEMDEVLNSQTSFNRKSYNRPTKYSR